MRMQALEVERQSLEDERKTQLSLLDEIWSASADDVKNQVPSSEGIQVQDEVKTSGEDVPRSNGVDRYFSRRSYASRRPATDRIRDILDEAEENEIITQPIVRQKFVEKYPGSDSNSLASAIAHILKGQVGSGKFELMREGKAGEPNQYRKKRKSGTEDIQEAKTKELVLRSEP